MMLILAALLAGMHPDPVEMPKAVGYLVTDGSQRHFEDRYERFDLWASHVMDGCWYSDDGRYFLAASLCELPPTIDADGVVTRVEYAEQASVPEKDSDRQLWVALKLLTGMGVSETFSRPQQLPRGMKELRYYSVTNERMSVAAFLPEGEDGWRVFTADLLAEEDGSSWRRKFEREYLEEREYARVAMKAPATKKRSRATAGERELLRADARHSVAAYPSWRVTDSEEFTILDDLPVADGFMAEVSNELSVARARFAAAIPSPLAVTNVLAVARIFASHQQYLEVCGADMRWSAAYWNPVRRELVAYLPEGGGAELMRTLRHEAFHQYLAYATAMLTVSPWFNEGYAQYFEERNPLKEHLAGDLKEHAGNIAALLRMGYDEFYAGSDEERHYKYRLARSIVYFIEHGAPEVFRQPFKELKRNYLAALLESKDCNWATAAAFGSEDKLERFIEEWEKFYKP